ncbi:hypothetical protein [Pseudoalteromonas spongiae]|uniref:hypothetical protein n=1 Tax=Pseudoalteromonas spongiae TaxID=298657 RepID=UPI000C2D5993|nr:hypothetical protein [Pseudoalteromonas spongiae]
MLCDGAWYKKYCHLTNKHAFWVLQAGVCIAIFQYTAEVQNWLPAKGEQLPFLALHIMVV